MRAQASFRQSQLVGLLRRLSLDRVLRYLDLWARYLWRRSQSALRPAGALGQGDDVEALATMLASANMGSAYQAAVASWFPLDLGNGRLRRALLASVADARPELGLTPEIIELTSQLKQAGDLAAEVDRQTEAGVPAGHLNTALYLLLLRRLPAPSERAMIASRHPRHALIAIQSGDEYRRAGRRTLPA